MRRNHEMCNNKVVSILGHPYVMPEYRDRRGRLRQFNAHIFGEKTGIEVRGTEVEFGLVLHRSLVPRNDACRRVPNWTISEPQSGRRVVNGFTRQDALDALAALVAFYGGAQEFTQALESSIQIASGQCS